MLDDFGQGIVITLKNPDGNRFVSDNYRGITLSLGPVISKLFEMVLLVLFENQLFSSPNYSSALSQNLAAAMHCLLSRLSLIIM